MLRTILIITAVILSTSLFASNPKANSTSIQIQNEVSGKVKSLRTQSGLQLAQIVIYSEETDLIKLRLQTIAETSHLTTSLQESIMQLSHTLVTSQN